MPDYSNLKRVFTVGGESEYYRNNNRPLLLFATLDPNDKDFYSPSVPIELSQTELVKEAMGESYFVYPGHDGDYPLWVFSLGLLDFVDSMEDPSSSERPILLKYRDQPLKVVDPAEISRECPLPQSLILGCNDCLVKSTKRSSMDCFVKSLVMDKRDAAGDSKLFWYSGDIPKFVTEHSINYLDSEIDDGNLVNGETVVGGFTYISPSMTAYRMVSPRFRDLSEHSFTNMEDRSEERSMARKETGRFSRFLKEECPKCVYMEKCHSYQNEHHHRGCSGPQTMTISQIADSILERVECPFTNSQLRYLLANSGRLHKRYDRCIAVGTLHVDSNRVSYRIRRKTKPQSFYDMAEFRNFRDAHKFLREYGNDMCAPYPSYMPRLTRELKAAMFSALSMQESPRFRLNWGFTTYPLSYALPEFGNAINLVYSYNDGSGPITWNSTVIRSLLGVYQAFGEIPLFYDPHESSPLRRR